MKRMIFLPAVLVILAGLAISLPVRAQQPTPSDDQVNVLARQLYCPVCENTPLDVCPTKACAQWREMIREKLQQGWSDQQIKDYFAEQYGEQVLDTPSAVGPNRMIYIVPAVLLLAGVSIAAYYIRSSHRLAKKGAIPTADTLPENDPYLARVEDELAGKKKR